MKAFRPTTTLLACAVLLAGCAGGAHASSPMLPITPTSHGKVNVSFVINAPAQSSTSQSAAQRSRGTATGVKPQYLSPATQSMTIAITGPTDITETQNLTIDSSGCTSSLASTICTLTVALAPCTSPPTNCYTADLTTYDQTGGTGNVLSAAQSIAFTVTAGQANSVNLTLSGVPASTIVTPADSLSTGNGAGPYDLRLLGPHKFYVESLDAAGNFIIGNGAPLFSISTPSGALAGVTTSPSTTTSSAPNSFTVTPPSTLASGTALFTVTPTFAGQATDGCAQSGANCAPLTVTVDMVGTLYVTNENSIVTSYTESGTEEGHFSAGLNSPNGIAYDPSNGYLYVANSGNSTVTYYSDSGTEESSFSAGLNGPRGIAYDPSNSDLYVANYGNSTVTYYAANGTEVSSFSAGLNSPNGIAYDPSNGYLYVANSGNSTVTYYSDSGTEEGSFSAGLNAPEGIAYDPSNSDLYVANYGNSTVTYYTANGTEVSSFSAGLDVPWGIAYDPSNGDLYVADSDISNTVTYYTANGTEEGSFSGGLAILTGITVYP